MRLLYYFHFLCVFSSVYGKNQVKSLTESMGQEVIEIGGELKDFPQDVDEEPSAEEDDPPANATTLRPGTKHELKKPAVPEIRRRGKDIDEIDRVDRVQREEEARIEKELAEIYKDTDYKGDDSSAKPKTPKSGASPKPGLRGGAGGFKLHPDHTDKASIERWRTSVDDVACDVESRLTGSKKMYPPSTIPPKKPNSAVRFATNLLPLALTLVVI